MTYVTNIFMKNVKLSQLSNDTNTFAFIKPKLGKGTKNVVMKLGWRQEY